MRQYRLFPSSSTEQPIRPNSSRRVPTVRDTRRQLELTTDISVLLLTQLMKVSRCSTMFLPVAPFLTSNGHLKTSSLDHSVIKHQPVTSRFTLRVNSGELTRCSGGCCSRRWEPSKWWSDAVSVGQTAEAYKAAAVTESREGCLSGAAARRRAQRKPFKTFKGSTALSLKQSEHWGFTAALISSHLRIRCEFCRRLKKQFTPSTGWCKVSKKAELYVDVWFYLSSHISAFGLFNGSVLQHIFTRNWKRPGLMEDSMLQVKTSSLSGILIRIRLNKNISVIQLWLTSSPSSSWSQFLSVSSLSAILFAIPPALRHKEQTDS